MFVNIEAERGRAQMTKEALSAELGISQPTYNAYVRGDSAIPSTILVKLSELFGVSTDYLLGRTDTRGGPA